MVAWLVTLVPSVQEQVVTVLNYRLSSSRVSKIIERYYVELQLGLSSSLEFVKSGRTPYPARMAVVNGVPYSEELYCGSGDRFLWARKVNNLRVIYRESMQEKFVWDERSRPDFSKLRAVLGLPYPEALAGGQAEGK